MFSTLTDDQRVAIAKSGTPFPLIDQKTGHAYVLLDVNLSPAFLGGVAAMVPGIQALGEGDGPDEALLAFVTALKNHLES